jgi:hypothetical protein
LSFDSAQDGEPVEPFRISIFEFRIFVVFMPRRFEAKLR